MNRFSAEVAGRAAREALAAGEGEVCAAFRRSFYLVFPGARCACVGDASLGRGPLNALVAKFRPLSLGDKTTVCAENSECWQPHNALSVHAQPALEAIERWLEPRLHARTSAVSAAHLAAAASGEVHEALHELLGNLSAWETPDLTPCLGRLDAVGHGSGRDALAGIVAVAKTSQ